MGQVRLSGRGAAAALETLVPVDIIDLPVGIQRYALFTNENGGVMDDLMVANFGDSLFVVVNAACKAQDIAHMQKHLSGHCKVEVLEDRALLALQGPAASTVMARLAPETAKMVFMTTAPSRSSVRNVTSAVPATPARTGSRYQYPSTRLKRWRVNC